MQVINIHHITYGNSYICFLLARSLRFFPFRREMFSLFFPENRLKTKMKMQKTNEGPSYTVGHLVSSSRVFSTPLLTPPPLASCSKSLPPYRNIMQRKHPLFFVFLRRSQSVPIINTKKQKVRWVRSSVENRQY